MGAVVAEWSPKSLTNSASQSAPSPACCGRRCCDGSLPFFSRFAQATARTKCHARLVGPRPGRLSYARDKPGRAHECRSKRLREVSHRGRWRARRWREGDSRVSDARTRFTGARAGPACSGDGHEDSRVLPAQLQPERPAGLPAKQYGRPRRHRRRHHGHRSGRVAGHGPQRRQKRHRQERVRHRDDLAGGLHGRVLLSRQGAAARARCHRPGAVGHQGQGAERAALSAVRGQGARAHRALCDLGSAPGPGSAGRSGGDGLEGSRGGDDGGGVSRVPRGRRHSAEHRPRGRRCRRARAAGAPQPGLVPLDAAGLAAGAARCSIRGRASG